MEWAQWEQGRYRPEIAGDLHLVNSSGRMNLGVAVCRGCWEQQLLSQPKALSYYAFPLRRPARLSSPAPDCFTLPAPPSPSSPAHLCPARPVIPAIPPSWDIKPCPALTSIAQDYPLPPGSEEVPFLQDTLFPLRLYLGTL